MPSFQTAGPTGSLWDLPLSSSSNHPPTKGKGAQHTSGQTPTHLPLDLIPSLPRTEAIYKLKGIGIMSRDPASLGCGNTTWWEPVLPRSPSVPRSS